MTAPKSCAGRVYGSETHCSRCGYVWDTNDPDPPKCKTPRDLYVEKQSKKNKEFIAKLRGQLDESEQT